MVLYCRERKIITELILYCAETKIIIILGHPLTNVYQQRQEFIVQAPNNHILIKEKLIWAKTEEKIQNFIIILIKLNI